MLSYHGHLLEHHPEPDCIRPLYRRVCSNDTTSYFTGVLIGLHFSGGGSILLALHQIPLQPDQLSPKCLADHPTSPTTVGNVQTAMAIRKMDACISPEDVLNTRYKSVSSTVCVLYTSIL